MTSASTTFLKSLKNSMSEREYQILTANRQERRKLNLNARLARILYEEFGESSAVSSIGRQIDQAKEFFNDEEMRIYIRNIRNHIRKAMEAAN